MKRKVLFLSFAPLFVLCAVVVPPASAQVVNETIWLDTYESSNDGMAGPLYSSDVLQGLYTVTVRGTFSFFLPSAWDTLCPGSPSPEDQPIYPSTGTATTGKVGSDAAYTFATVSVATNLCGGGTLTYPLPHEAAALQFNLNGTWTYMDPDVAGYQPTHKYVYTVAGTGNTFGVQLPDNPTSDNYGMLQVGLHRWGQQVTGGGKINVPGTKQPEWTLAGTVGFDPGSAVFAGQFQIVDHVNRVSCHFDTFSNLVFSGPATVSPPSLFSIATFDASGRCNDGSKPNISVEIWDYPEPTPDMVQVSGDISVGPVSIDGGNFQVYVQQ